MSNPGVLPIDQIEPAFAGAIPVCMEMHTKSGGLIDNLLVTPKGDLILVECKLWRNYEARRRVVTQILGYAQEIATFNYDELEAAIKRARKEERPLYKIANTSPDTLPEREFFDAVSKGLRSGRFLLLVVGDGIHEGLEDLVEFVQQHAGLHFTLGLVDVAIFEAPSAGGGYYVQPRVIAHTMNIVRGIVSLKEGFTLTPPPSTPDRKQGSPFNITEEQFYEALAKTDPKLPDYVQRFFEKVISDLGIDKDFGEAAIVLRWGSLSKSDWNLGSIDKKGRLHTRWLDIQAKGVGLRDPSNHYQERLRDLIPGAQIRKRNDVREVVKASGQPIEALDLLKDPKKKDGWIAAIEEFMDAVNKNDATE